MDVTQKVGLAAFLNARLDEDEGYLKSNRHHLWTQRPFREVEAKRAILEAHTAAYDYDGSPCTECEHLWPCGTLHWIAAVYSDHPDYRTEWRS
jgi:hypothetical protein